MNFDNALLYKALHHQLGLKPIIASVTAHPALMFAHNCLLALKARPFVIRSCDDACDALQKCQALVVNFDGMTDAVYNTVQLVLSLAINSHKPIILDPGGVSFLGQRLEKVSRLITNQNVTVIRATASEIIALASSAQLLDHFPNDYHFRNYKILLSSARSLSKKYNCVIVVNGEVDLVCDYGKYMFLANGVQLQTAVSGMGNALTHLLAYFMSCCLDETSSTVCQINQNGTFSRFDAALTALCLYNYAAELTHILTQSLGQFAYQYLSTLANFATLPLEKYPGLCEAKNIKV